MPGIDAVLFTQANAEHVMGLDEVRILNRIAGRPLPAFGTEATLDDLAERFGYAFRPWKPPGFYRPVMERRPFAYGEHIDAAGLAVHVFEQDHHVTRTAGLRIGPFGYSTDVVRLDDAGFAALQGMTPGCSAASSGLRTRPTPIFERIIEWAAVWARGARS